MPLLQPRPPKRQLFQSVASSAEELAAIAQWDKDERSAKSLLTQKILDSALMKLQIKKSIQECWDMIVREYTEKGVFAQPKWNSTPASLR